MTDRLKANDSSDEEREREEEEEYCTTNNGHQGQRERKGTRVGLNAL
jgi:hypothetical protein